MKFNKYQKINCNNTCNTCEPQKQFYYCGRDKPCVDIQKGDELSEIISKLADEVCNLKDVEYQNLIFTGNDQCDNGGFKVYDGIVSQSSLLYSTCFPCCGEGTGSYRFIENIYSEYSDRSLEVSLIEYWKTLHELYPLLPDVKFVAPEDGYYKITVKNQIENEDSATQSTTLRIGVGVNGSDPYNTTYSLSDAQDLLTWRYGYPPDSIFFLSLSNGDEVRVYFKDPGFTSGVAWFAGIQRITVEKIA